MVTPASCTYATINFAYHERKKLLPKYKKNLLLFIRFSDDRFGIWVPSDDPNAWKIFKENLPFGILEWEVEEHTTSVNCLDLTISINEDRKIETRTYQRAMNIYLYLPPTSALPLSVIRGMIYGMLRKYDKQNSHQKCTSKWQCFYSEDWPCADEKTQYCNVS